jgi:hypothetical protein
MFSFKENENIENGGKIEPRSSPRFIDVILYDMVGLKISET